ncbi:methyltransferase domain-containing protein [Mesorhizobium sp. M0118]|uniref:class I SAM-dependent methyltransferase n=1 Tax=Mesorhizobium sp. M0118 TaxID=2956884 RepID=UPI00333C24A4
MGIARRFINFNIKVCRWIDGFLPIALRRDGNEHFLSQILPGAFSNGSLVYDLGGGSEPCIRLEDKIRMNLRVVGIDISAEELAAAPSGIYDETIAADLCQYTGRGDADSVVCQATLEHVYDTGKAIRGIASVVRPGGRVFIFAPCRNALFARINLILPESIKRRILFAIFPKKGEGHDGFRAYYDKCVPSLIEELALQNGLIVEERNVFWISSYFSFFVPFYILWRGWQLVSFALIGKDAGETFAYVLRRNVGGGTGARQGSV